MHNVNKDTIEQVMERKSAHGVTTPYILIHLQYNQLFQRKRLTNKVDEYDEYSLSLTLSCPILYYVKVKYESQKFVNQNKCLYLIALIQNSVMISKVLIAPATSTTQNFT